MPLIAQGLGMCIHLTSVLYNNVSHCRTSSLFNITVPYSITSSRPLHTDTEPVQQYRITLTVQQNHSDISTLQNSITLTSPLFNNTAPHFSLKLKGNHLKTRICPPGQEVVGVLI
jgi:hypothetical protein